MLVVFGLNAMGFAGLAGDEPDGNSFETAIPLDPWGEYTGFLEGGENDDYWKFHLEAGDSVNIELRDTLRGGSLPAPDNDIRLSFRLLSPQGVLLETPHTNQGDTRLMMSAVPVTGDYRFHVTQDMGGFRGAYRFCFLAEPPAEHPCPDYGMRQQEITFGGTLSNPWDTSVLLIPPAHGDLGNPFGPTAVDYLDAAISGIREWERVLSEFAADYPEYDYLDDIEVDIAVFDGTQVQSNYDIVISYVPTGGTQFRGAATTCVNPPRCIVLSLYSMSPRAGQTLPDYPEVSDMEAVTKHEFAHVWGLGHTLTWTEEHGPDMMNSPATFVYGDGSPVGDGGERTGKQCISTLNLYGMTLLFGHGWSSGSYALPDHIPYEWYC